MQILDYQVEALKYALPYLRTNEDVVALLKAIGLRFTNLQTAIVYLLNTLDIRKARGVWLDYAGAEVGAQRDEDDYGNYFCVNRLHINEEKLFYFLTSGTDPESPLSLNDAQFLQKIFAYIGANTSCCTRNENIAIIKTITNADSVIIKKVARCTLTIDITGNALITTQNTIRYIQQVLCDGVFLQEITLNGKAP